MLIASAEADIAKMATNDVLFFLGGTNDVIHSITDKSLSFISQFVKRLTDTNVVMASVSYCHDLPATSTVSQEIHKFNRKLKNYVRQDMYVTVLDVISNRKYFTKHVFHLNGKGKTNVCMQLKALVETPYTSYGRSPILMEWIMGREEDTNVECIEGSGYLDNSLSNNRVRVSSRSRRTPHNRSEDLLWEM